MLIRNKGKRSREEFEETQHQLDKDLQNGKKEKTIMQMENLKVKVTEMEKMEEAYLIDRDKLHSLFEKGIIDESGAPIIQNISSDMM